jgi:hypothetical protein
MRAQLVHDEAVEDELPGSVAGAWKWALRKQMWDFMEANDIARCAALVSNSPQVRLMAAWLSTTYVVHVAGCADGISAATCFYNVIHQQRLGLAGE